MDDNFDIDKSDSLISPKLLQDLLNLEKDYKYNLSLLKIKDSEIERCNAAYINLQADLQSSQAEGVALQVQQTHLQQRTDALERQLSHEKLETQRVKSEACRQIDVLRQQEAQERLNFSRQEAEAEDRYRQMLQDRQDENNRQIQELKDSVAEKQLCINDLQMKLSTESDKFQHLKTDQEESSSNQQRTLSGYQKQLELLKDGRDRSAQDLLCVRKEWTNMKSERDQLKNKLELSTSRIEDLISEQKRLFEENGKLLICYTDSEKESQRYRTQNQELKTALDAPLCNIAAHHHFLKQNKILRELVKAMKKKGPSNDHIDSVPSTSTTIKPTVKTRASFASLANYVHRAAIPDDVFPVGPVPKRVAIAATTSGVDNALISSRIAKLEHLVELLKMKLVN